MKQALKLAGATTLVLALATLGLSQDGRIYREGGNWVQEVKGELTGAKNLKVKLDAGSIKVQGGSQSNITYVLHRRAFTSSEQKARHEFESNRMVASVRGDTALLIAQGVGENRRCSDDLVVTVPRQTEYARVETGGGNVNATAIAGRVELETGGGTIHVDDIGNEVKAETGGGAIEIGTVGGDVSLQTGGGNVKINAVKGNIKAETGGGNLVVLSGLQGAVLQTGGGSIRLDKCSGRVKASTGGGSIDLGEIGGPVEIESGAGSIRLASSNGRVEAQTGGGSIQLDRATSVRAETGAGGIVVKLVSSSDMKSSSTLLTSAGDITVYLSKDIPITVRAAIDMATGHTIRTDFGDIHVSNQGNSPWPRSVTAEGSLNGGGPVLKVRTSSGNISFLRLAQK
ncbi:MAG TPA: hypothetical protein VMI10_25140 [Terriglobales bacterium]|nr:hypothetical protein [Terriglobales bacterium]